MEQPGQSIRKFETIQLYYNKRFPKFFQDCYQNELDFLYADYLEQFLEVIKEKNYSKNIIYLTSYLEKICEVYGLTLDQKELLTSIHFHLIFNENDISLFQKNILFSNLSLVASYRKKMKNLQLNWRSFLEYFEKFYFSNERVYYLSPVEFNKQFRYLEKIVKRNKRYFEKNSVSEVIQFFRQNFSPQENYLNFFYLKFFLNIDQNSPKQELEDLLKELIEICPHSFLHIFMNLLNQISRVHKDIHWEQYYQRLFKYFLFIVESLLPSNGLNSYNYFKSSQNVVAIQQSFNEIPSILVNLLVPSSHPNFNTIWSHIERIFTLLQNFIHPQNEGKWTVSLIYFYRNFCSRYINRYKIEQNLPKKSPKTQQDSPLNYSQKVELEDEDQDFDEEDFKINEEVNENVANEEYDLNNEDELENDEFFEKKEVANKHREFLELYSQFILDEESHEKFMQIMMTSVKFIIFLKYNKDASILSMCMKLSYFRPYKVIPFILETLYSLFEMNEMGVLTSIRILLHMIKPLISRNIYKPGLYEIINILKLTSNHISASNMKLTDIILKLYNKIFQFLPIYDIDDLQEEYERFHPNEPNSKENFYLKLNENEDEQQNMQKFTEDLSEWAIEYFKKILSLLEYVELPKLKEDRNFRTIFVNVHNRFWSFFFQSSKSLFKRYLELIAESIEYNIHIKAQEYYAYFLQCCSMIDAKMTLNKLWPILSSKIICKRKEKSSEPADHNRSPLYVLIEKSPIRDRILGYQLDHMSKDSMLWYLNLLEDCLSFAGKEIEPFHDDIQTVLFLLLISPEESLNSKAAKIINKILLSLNSVYPKEFRCFNPSEYESEEFAVFFYKKIGYINKMKFEVSWHETSDQERSYSNRWLKETFWIIMHECQKKYFSSKHSTMLDLNQNLEQTIDEINLKVPEPQNNLKNEILKYLMIIEQTFAGISQRTSQTGAKENAIFKNFKQNFLFVELEQMVTVLLEFVENLFNFFLEKDLYQDYQIMTLYLKLISQMIGDDQYNNKMISLKHWLRQVARNYKNPIRNQKYDTRFHSILDCTLHMYKHIYSYYYNALLQEQYYFLQNIVLILCFHPYQKISMKATPIFNKLILSFENWETNTSKFLFAIFEFISNKLDQYSPQLKAEEKQQNPTIQNYLEKLIKSTDLFINIADTTNSLSLYPDLLNLILKIFTSYENIQHQQLQNKLFEIFLLRFLMSFENPLVLTSDSLNNRYNTLIKIDNPIIISSCKKFYEIVNENIYQNQQSPSGILQKKQEIQQCYLNIIDISIDRLNNAQIHWRQKIIYGLIALGLCTVLDPQKDQQFQELMLAYIQGCNDDHQFVRQLCRPAIVKLMRYRNRCLCASVKTIHLKQDQQQQFSIKQLLRRKFLDEKLYQQYYISNINDGYYDQCFEIKVKEWKPLSDEIIKKDLLFQLVQEKQFCHRIIENICLDISVVIDNQQQGMSGFMQSSSKLLHEIQGFVNGIFNKNRKRVNSFKKIEISYEVYARFFKQIFKNYGMVFYNHTKDLIEQYAENFHCLEKQVTVSRYLYGLLKSISLWLGPLKQQQQNGYSLNSNQSQQQQQQRKEIIEWAAQIIYINLENVSKELFQDWIYVIYMFFHGRDIREFQDFFDFLLGKLKKSLKTHRLITYLTVLLKFGYREQKYIDEVVRFCEQFQPKDSNSSQEFSVLLCILFKTLILSPFNMKLIQNYFGTSEFILESHDLDNTLQHDESEIIYYQKNEACSRIIAKLSGYIDESKTSFDKQKLMLIGYFISYFHQDKKIDLNLAKNLERIISFHLEFNEEDISDQILIKLLNENSMKLSNAVYSQKACLVILNLLQNNFKNNNWRVRLRALNFYHFFIFKNIFQIDGLLQITEEFYELLVDENPKINNTALNCLSDILKLTTKYEQQCFIDFFFQAASQDFKDASAHQLKEKIKAIYALMALLLAFPNEVYLWTEKVLRIVLQNKKITQSSYVKLKEFCSKFWKNKAISWQLLGNELSDDLLSNLREIANPYNYFA